MNCLDNLIMFFHMNRLTKSSATQISVLSEIFDYKQVYWVNELSDNMLENVGYQKISICWVIQFFYHP